MKRRWFANNDIPIEVLSRLPTKTLLQLKCVSKEWQLLLSDRSFIKVQITRTDELISGFFFQERLQWCDTDIKSISYIPVNMELGAEVHRRVLGFLPESVVVLSSTNGLLCCRSCLPCPCPILYVCNPTNKEWVSLEFPTPDIGKSVALAFDTFRDPIDVSTNFKLVRVCQTVTKNNNNSGSESETEEECVFSFDIYSSRTGSWRRSNEICKCTHNLFKNKGIFAEGMLYWLTDGDQVVMFDPEKEFSLLLNIPLPASHFSCIPEMCIGESEGKLHYVLVSEFGLQVWALKDWLVHQWELKCSIALDKLEEENSELLYNVQERVTDRVAIDMVPWIDPLAFKDGLVLMRVSTDIFSFHFETRKLRKLAKLSMVGQNSMFAPIVLPYVMGLVPLFQE